MRFFKYFAAAALLLAVISQASADIAIPGKTRARRDGEIRRDLPYAQMTIERVEGLREARLQIPRSHIGPTAAAASTQQGGGFRDAGTIVAGLFLSLAAVLTGLFVLRSRRGVAVGRAAVVLLVCACAAGLAAVAAYANIAPPLGYRPQDPGTLLNAVSDRPLTGSIRVEIVEEGDGIKLLVPAKTRKGVEEEE